MGKIISYEFLKIIRNKRFISFSLIVPLIFYVILVTITKAKSGNDQLITMFAVLCSVFATIGGGINTLSSRIAREKMYIGNVLVTTPYTPAKFIITTTLVQTLLGFLIEVVIVLFGAVIYRLNLNIQLLNLELIVLCLSIFYVLIGLCLGILCDSVTLQTLSFPIYILAMATNANKVIWPQAPDLLITLEKILPGYYATQAIIDVFNYTSYISDLLKVFIYIFIMMIVAIVIYSIKKDSIVAR